MSSTDSRDNGSQSVRQREAGITGFLKVLWGFIRVAARDLWDFFSSMRTAIVLLLVLAAASIAGTVIKQNALDDFYIQRYGDDTAKLIRAFVLDDTYNSWWYITLLTLVGINLAVCSINRFRVVWRSTSSPKVVVSAKQITGMQRSETIASARQAAEIASRIETALRSSAYHVLRAQDKDDEIIYASRGRLSLWGPYLTHLSILVIFLGAIVGGRLGLDGVAIITEGETVNACYMNKTGEPQGLGFEVELRDFTIGRDEDRNPTSYQSDLRITDKGKQVASKVIDVNHPLTYKGVSFYQSDYGLDSISLKVTAPNGESKRVTFEVRKQDGPHGRQYSISSASGDMAFEQITLGGRTLTVFAHEFAPDYVGGDEVYGSSLPLNPAAYVLVNDRLPEYKGMDAWMKLGWMDAGKSVKFKGYTITMEEPVDYTVLQVGKNPGLPLVYTGFALMLFGVFVSFYVTRKVIRVRVSPSSKGSSVLVGANSRSEPSVFDTDLEHLKKAVE